MLKFLFSGVLVLLFNFCVAQINTVGVTVNSGAAFPGYTLFSPVGTTTTYLIDNQGRLVHEWESQYYPGLSQYLLEDGMLYRAGVVSGADAHLSGSGEGGVIEKIDWDGIVIWAYKYSDQGVRQHHDFEVMPNGNVLILAWEKITKEQAVQAGRDPDKLAIDELWPDHIVEVKPSGSDGGTIVWEWHVSDHLIQDFDVTKDNFGVVMDHPELIDINYIDTTDPGWTHGNSIDYNQNLDQIILSIRSFDELWIIDHSTTTVESSSHEGGAFGQGGDILYRWGNPQAYRQGTASDQSFFGQHDVQWITEGLPNEGLIMIFNNGLGRLEGNYSSVEILKPQVDDIGMYIQSEGKFGPLNLEHTYTLEDKDRLSADVMSGAQQLPNGNILICDSPHATFVEINPSGSVVWEYVSPITFHGLMKQGDPIGQSLSVFRATRYGFDDIAFEGKPLYPGKVLELPGQSVLSVQYENPFNVRIYPNPASESIIITLPDFQKEAIFIYNQMGQLVHQEGTKSNKVLINTSDWSRGIYLMRMGDFSERIIIH